MSIDPVIPFFLLGILARLLKSDLRLPEALYEALSVYLLLALGLAVSLNHRNRLIWASGTVRH